MGHAKGWTCQRQAHGVKCHFHNAPRTRKCGKCGKPRPAKHHPAHMVALEHDYQHFVDLNGGDHCGICNRPRSTRRRLDRDHDHKTAKPRGLLCPRCNRALPSWMDEKWLRRALAYLERSSRT